MNNISTIIVAKDSPPHLFETIQSASDISSKIIVIDIGIDQSVLAKLMSQAKIKVVKMNEPVPYVELIRQKSISHAGHDYILMLDPDEVLSESLKKVLTENYQKYDFVRIPRKNIIFSSWIKHSRWWPDYQIRLFKKGSVIWPPVLHAQPETTGEGLTIEPQEDLSIIHYNYNNLNEFLEKMTRYASSEAQERIDNKENYTLSKAFTMGINEFISRYFASQGYKDGVHGLVLAFLQMFYYFLVYTYFWEKKGYKTTESNDSIIEAGLNFFKKGLYETMHWVIHENLIQSTNAFKNKIIKFLLK